MCVGTPYPHVSVPLADMTSGSQNSFPRNWKPSHSVLYRTQRKALPWRNLGCIARTPFVDEKTEEQRGYHAAGHPCGSSGSCSTTDPVLWNITFPPPGVVLLDQEIWPAVEPQLHRMRNPYQRALSCRHGGLQRTYLLPAFRLKCSLPGN